MPSVRSSSRARASTSAKAAPASPAPQARGRSRSRSTSRARPAAASRKSSTARPKKVVAAKDEEESPERVAPTPKRAIRTRSRSAVRAAVVTIDKKDEEAEDVAAAVPAADGARLRRSVRAARAAGDAAEPAQLEAIAADEAASKVSTAAAAHTPEPYQFGGPIGAFFIFAFSHFLVMYFFACVHHNNGALLLPRSLSVEAGAVWAKQLWAILATHAAPTWWAVKVFWIFQVVQALLAVVLPGAVAKGLPIPSEGGQRLSYLCNAVATWWITLPVMYALNHYNVFRLSSIIDNIGPLTTVAMLSSDLIAVAVHAAAFIKGKAAADRSGNWFYDFFMGVWLNPRIGSLDLKMWAEVRVSWIMLFLITAASAAKQYELYGRIGPGMALILTAQFLYTNAIMKGEDCIPTTWDIFHEKWGWMLIFWNLCGVPFVYTVQATFLVRRPIDFVQYPTAVWVGLYVLLFVAYYAWDTANSQKNRFRMVLQGTYVPRPFAFPQLPWGTVYNPKHIVTKAGTPLFVDGWYAYARKFHYTTDVTMATIWALSCGYSHFIPFFYVFFFVGFLSHRAKRDEERCATKYGADWQEYLKRVPYRFIPGVY